MSLLVCLVQCALYISMLANVFYLPLCLSVYHLSMSSVIQLPILSGGGLSNILEVQFLGGSISVSFREGQGNHSYLTHLFSLRNLFLNVTLHEILTCTKIRMGPLL